MAYLVGGIKMKYGKLIIFLFATMILLIGCNTSDNPFSQARYAEKQCKTIVECFDTKDLETIKNMFSSWIQETHNLDKEIQDVFDLYEGKSVHWDYVDYGSEGAIDDGKWTEKRISPTIDIETDAGKKYHIVFYDYLVYEKDEARLGIQYIIIYDTSNNNDIVYLKSIGE